MVPVRVDILNEEGDTISSFFTLLSEIPEEDRYETFYELKQQIDGES
jgi:hypothetical protein